MCEILIRVHDKVNPNSPYLDVGCTKRGDVISVCADAWPWSQAELKNPDWRILKLPNVSVAFALAFIAKEVDTTGNPLNRMLRKRGIKFNIDDPGLVTAQSFFTDDTRANPTRTFAVTETQVWAFHIVKPPLADPGVL